MVWLGLASGLLEFIRGNWLGNPWTRECENDVQHIRTQPASWGQEPRVQPGQAELKLICKTHEGLDVLSNLVCVGLVRQQYCGKRWQRHFWILLFKNIDITVLKYKTSLSKLVKSVHLWWTFIMCQSLCSILEKDGEKIDTGKPDKGYNTMWSVSDWDKQAPTAGWFRKGASTNLDKVSSEMKHKEELLTSL